MDSNGNPDRSSTYTAAVPQPSQDLFARPGTFSYRFQNQGSANVQGSCAVNIPATEASASSTTQPPLPSAGGNTGGLSPGNATLVAAPSSNHDASGSSIQATVDALSSERDKISPYEKLYPGFDPEEDLEVNPSWLIDICKWGNCEGVQCRVDKMWLHHIFAESKNAEDKSHKAEILAPKTRLPHGHVRCLWKGCERSMPVGSMKKHIEDAHLYLYRLKCIHCGTEKRRDSYRDSHGPASMCPKNPRFVQAALPPCPPQRKEQNACAQASSMPPPPRVLNPKSVVPSSTLSVPPFAKNARYIPYTQVLVDTAPTDETPQALNSMRAQGRLHSIASSSAHSADPMNTYQDSLAHQLDTRMQSLWSSLYPRRPAIGAGAPTQQPWRTPAAILALHSLQHKATHSPPAAPHPFTPTCINPELLVLRRPADTPKVPQAVPTSQTRDGDPNVKAQMGERRDVPGGRREALQQAIQRPAAAPAPAPTFRTWDVVLDAPGPANPSLPRAMRHLPSA